MLKGPITSSVEFKASDLNRPVGPPATALAFSPAGSRLATGDRVGGIYLWESATGGIVVSLSDQKDTITSLSWRGDGALLASGSEDGQIII